MQNNHALALGPFVSVDAGAENGLKGPNIVISGANVHIESGSGNTFDFTGLGNLVIGYDEDGIGASTIDANRTGSHNLVIGADHQFTASGGAVFGFGNFRQLQRGQYYRWGLQCCRRDRISCGPVELFQCEPGYR